jgi:DNA-directed RNA polymerase subunit beta'
MFPERDYLNVNDFDSIRLKLASPEGILDWSFGEVTKPETINYRTQKPEKDGLFDERIFGPTKDWECYCGKYKRIRYRGIVCDKCGVEVTRSVVRRERFGHIRLASPVSHIWFLRGVPSKIGLVLGLSVQELEKVVYFASFIIISVDEVKKQALLDQVTNEYKTKRKTIESEAQRQVVEAGKKFQGKDLEAERKSLEALKNEKVKKLEEAFEIARRELKELRVMQIISESQYQDLSLKYGQVFEASIGAEALRELLERVKLENEIKLIESGPDKNLPAKQKKITRRLKLLKSLLAVGLRPEWMVLTVLPVIPPDLRPMVQLDGGRFATSDLNDLYRRVINRNNRLKRLLELNAPEVICRNEKRMLQEAVDALIDNSARHGKTVTASTGQRRMLKSIADILKGKQGRFRQNLLGKRIDYSGRSVIVVGPKLELHQCGLPKRMALELFKPFIISKLIKRELVHNVRSANRFIESGRSEVWDILEEIIKGAYVLLNRAPTLHRLGIQAFQPILIEGKAIQVHPLVCPAFNADFDGDQMAVHVPLTEEAKWEAANIMLSSKNLLKPATGEPVSTPAQDIVLGCYYMTNQAKVPESAKPKLFANKNEAILAYQSEYIKLQEAILVHLNNEKTETCVGRILFNEILPPELGFVNKTVDKKALKNLVSESLLHLGIPITAKFLDRLKEIGFDYLTRSGLSWGMSDLPGLPEREEIYNEAENQVAEINDQYQQGLLTEEERHVKVIEIWAQVKERVTEFSRRALPSHGSVYSMIESGARGSWGQITQMMGMKGLVTNPGGETIELPVKGNFKEGFDVLEYFISTHGARKGLTDIALRTANAGYLTRRLVDVAHDIVVVEEDCGDKEGVVLTAAESEEMGDTLGARVVGRFLFQEVKDPASAKVVVKKNELVNLEQGKLITKINPTELKVRSALSCKTKRGICQKCYGSDLGCNALVEIGTAVGIIAAQSIGEPGTQLTMRTFHTGGVASAEDITQGLPRVEEIFEARPVKRPALLSLGQGQVKVESRGRQKFIKLTYMDKAEEKFVLAKYPDCKVLVKKGAKLKPGNPVLKMGETIVPTVHGGVVNQVDNEVVVAGFMETTKEFAVPIGMALWVKDGDLVTRGQQLTEGSLDLHELYALKDKEAVQKYILKEIQYIYSSQGQKLNDKHIEVIIRQIFSRLYITEPGDTELLPGEVVTVAQFGEANEALPEGATPAQGDNLLLGITKSSLSTDSFLSAASFQETARVLIDAAVTGKVDKLRGLKENVIIGRLIPAGTGLGPQKGRLQVAMDEVEHQQAIARVAAAAAASQAAQEAAQAALLAEQALIDGTPEEPKVESTQI